MGNITFLGAGAMGSRMVHALLHNGHAVTVWNRNASNLDPLIQLGAQTASTPRLAVSHADFVISMVRDDKASRSIWLDDENGALSGLPTDAVAIECSTVTVDWAQSLAEQCCKRHVPLLDAPVVGSRPQADAAQLIFLVGGEPDVLTQAKPILSAMGSAVWHMGPSGSGAAMKLIVNSLFGAQLAMLAELLGFSQRNGLVINRVIEVLSTLPVCSPAAKMAAGAMQAGNFSPLFPIELVHKDFIYALESAKSVGADLPLTHAVSEIFSTALLRGLGNNNITGVAKLYL